MRVHTGHMPCKRTFPACLNSHKWQLSLDFHERLHPSKPDDNMETKRKVATKILWCFRVPSSAAAVPAAAVLAEKKDDSVVVIDESDGEGEGEGKGKRKGKPVCHTDTVSAVPVVFITETDDEDNGEGEKGERCESAMQPAAPPDDFPKCPHCLIHLKSSFTSTDQSVLM